MKSFLLGLVVLIAFAQCVPLMEKRDVDDDDLVDVKKVEHEKRHSHEAMFIAKRDLDDQTELTFKEKRHSHEAMFIAKRDLDDQTELTLKEKRHSHEAMFMAKRNMEKILDSGEGTIEKNARHEALLSTSKLVKDNQKTH
ncbi:unnamed protein product [Brachionus calyciflorus]|uniref:Uncharacterized protein n=1 Tax=Brachionus calyciflorus TaxID=104777 RepID=A0A813WXI8_9BILA|nr:unnamed protein product [Brachionus calyciflorus]